VERNFSVLFGALEADYAFSRSLSLSTILQVDIANAQAMSADIRVRWHYRPDSDLYVIHTAGQQFASLGQFPLCRPKREFCSRWLPARRRARIILTSDS
jgi:hypothetical protein